MSSIVPQRSSETLSVSPSMTLRPSSLGNTINHWIGRSAYTTDPYFAGLLDDFRVYARALNASEITTLYTTVR